MVYVGYRYRVYHAMDSGRPSLRALRLSGSARTPDFSSHNAERKPVIPAGATVRWQPSCVRRCSYPDAEGLGFSSSVLWGGVCVFFHLFRCSCLSRPRFYWEVKSMQCKVSKHPILSKGVVVVVTFFVFFGFLSALGLTLLISRKRGSPE